MSLESTPSGTNSWRPPALAEGGPSDATSVEAGRARVSLGPPAPWVEQHDVDLEWRGEGGWPSDALLIDHQHHVASHSRHVRVVQRINTIQAAQELGQWRLDFDPLTDWVTIHHISILRNGERIEQAQLNRLRFLQREEELDELVLTGQTDVVLLLEDLRAGDVLDWATTVRTEPELYLENWAMLSCVSHGFPVRRHRLSVQFPEGRALRWKSNFESLAPAVENRDGTSVWTWERDHIKPFSFESNVPSWRLQGGWVQVTDFPSWEFISAAADQAWEAAPDEPSLDDFIESLGREKPDASSAEIIESILRFVQDEIRYLSVKTALGGRIPVDPGTVLKRRFGDCKDKTFLAVRLLRRAGVAAQAVLVHTRLCQTVGEWLPMPVFNHVVVRFELGGEMRYVDVTASHQGGGPMNRFCPTYRAGLPLARDGEGLAVLPVSADRSETHVHELFELDTAGNMTGLTVKAKMRGADADAWRHSILRWGFINVAKKRESDQIPNHEGLRRVGEMTWADDREANVLTITDRYEIPCHWQITDDRHHMIFQHRADFVAGAVNGALDTDRKHPFFIPYPCRIVQEIEVVATIPKWLRSAHLRFSDRHFVVDLKVVPKPHGFRAVYTYETKAFEVPGADFGAYMAAIRKFHENNTIVFAVARGQRAHRGPLTLKKDPATLASPADARQKPDLMPAHPRFRRDTPPVPPARRAFSSMAKRDNQSATGTELPGETDEGDERPVKLPDPAPASERSQPGPATELADPRKSPGVPPPKKAAPESDVFPLVRKNESPLPATSTPRIASASPVRRGRKAVEMPPPSGRGVPQWAWAGFGCLAFLGVIALILFAVGIVGTGIQYGSGQLDDGNLDGDPTFPSLTAALNDNRLDEATAAITELRGRYPRSNRLRFMAAAVHLQQGRSADALREIDKALAGLPAVERAHTIKAEALWNLDRKDEAIRWLESHRYLVGNPMSLDLARAQFLAKRGDFATAEPLCREVIQKYPEETSALNLMCDIHVGLKTPEKARDLLLGVVAAHPGSQDWAGGVAEKLTSLGFGLEGQHVAERAMVDFPRSSLLALRIGEALRAQGRAQDAFKRFVEATQLNPHETLAWMGAGDLLERDGQVAKATEMYLQATNDLPPQPAAIQQVAAKVGARSALAAKILFERATKLAPGSAVLWQQLAEAHKALGETGPAKEAFDKAAALQAAGPAAAP